MQNQHKRAKVFALTVSEHYSSITAGEAKHNLYFNSQIVASWFASHCLWTQMSWAYHRCLRFTFSMQKSVLFLKLSPLFTAARDPLHQVPKSGSFSRHSASEGAPSYLIPTTLYGWSCPYHSHRRRIRKLGARNLHQVTDLNSDLISPFFFSYFRGSSVNNFSPEL